MCFQREMNQLTWINLLVVCAMLSWGVAMSSDMNPEKFYDVVSDHRVWLLEFYSPMCGSCKEFAPVWQTVEDYLERKVMTAKINIDSKAGMKIAEAVGALEDGIPALVLFKSSDDARGTSMGIQDSKLTKAHVLKVLKKHLKSFSKSDEGYYLKMGSSEL